MFSVPQNIQEIIQLLETHSSELKQTVRLSKNNHSCILEKDYAVTFNFVQNTRCRRVQRCSKIHSWVPTTSYKPNIFYPSIENKTIAYHVKEYPLSRNFRAVAWYTSQLGYWVNDKRRWMIYSTIRPDGFCGSPLGERAGGDAISARDLQRHAQSDVLLPQSLRQIFSASLYVGLLSDQVSSLQRETHFIHLHVFIWKPWI